MQNRRNNNTTRRATRALVGSVLLLALAACNSGGSADQSGSSSTAPSKGTATSTATSSSESSSATSSSSADGSYDHVDLPGLTPKIDEKLVNDPAVMTGTLDNGLRYFVQKNDDPGQSAEMRLVINAGSVDEQGKTGIAHFLEHMLFNGTEKYPKNELIDVLRANGTQFGADINAYTSFDETVYMLKVPTEPEAFNTGLDVLNEWLSHATIAPDAVDAERGVVLDEFRQRTKGAQAGVLPALAHEYYAGTAYEDRLPIGTQSDLETATAEDLRTYYEQWYRPSNASVVVVGDVDVNSVVAQITDLFGGTADPSTPEPERPDTSTDELFNAETEPRYSVVTDPDDLWTSVDIGLPLAALPVDSTDRWQASIYDEMIFSMLQRRLQADVQAGTAPFDDISMSSDSLTNNLDAPSLLAQTDDPRAGDAMQAVLDEYERAARFGFDDSEFEVARKSIQTQLDSLSEGAETTDDAAYAHRIVAFGINGSPYPAITEEVRIKSAILKGATPDGLHQRFLARWTNTAPFLLVDSPTDKPETLPTEADLIAAVSSLATRELEPRAASDAATTAQLMERPQPVEPTDQQDLQVNEQLPTEKERANFKPVQYTYPNGVRVIVNPSQLAEGQVTMSAISLGGSSVLDTGQVPDALVAPLVVTQSGVGDFDTTQLQDIMSSSDVQLSADISTYYEGFDGTFASRDSEKALAYLNLLMTAPQVDQTVLDTTISTAKPLANDPQFVVMNGLSVARYGDDSRHQFLPAAAQFDTITKAGVEAVWKDRFSNASDWVFVFSGDVKPDEFIQLSNSYLGTLPSSGPDRPIVNVSRPMPAGVTTNSLQAGTGGDAQLAMLFEAPVASVDAKTLAIQQVANAVLDARIIDVAREQFGETYSPSIFAYTSHDPGLVDKTEVSITGTPESMSHLTSVVVEQVTDLGTNGPTADEFKQAVAETRTQYNSIDDTQIVFYLSGAAVFPDKSVDSFTGQAKALDQVTAADVRAYIAKNLPPSQYISVTVLPGAESSSTEADSSSTTG